MKLMIRQQIQYSGMVSTHSFGIGGQKIEIIYSKQIYTRHRNSLTDFNFINLKIVNLKI